MKKHRFEWFLGAVLAALFVAFWIWQSPGDFQKLSIAEVDAYLHKLEGKLPGNSTEQAAFLGRMRAFGLADDGRLACRSCSALVHTRSSEARRWRYTQTARMPKPKPRNAASA